MIKIMLFIFVQFFIGHAYAEKINFCNTIEFDMGDFDQHVIRNASKKFDCRKNPIPLVLNYQGKEIKKVFYLNKEERPDSGLLYKERNEKTDREETKSKYFITELKSYCKGNKNFCYTIKGEFNYAFNVFSKGNGILVISDLVLLKNKLPYSKQRYLLFHQEGSYGAYYITKPILLTDKKEIYFMEKMTDLFKSMEISG